MTALIATVCASIVFVRSGHIPDPYPAFDIYWQDYAIDERIQRTYAIAIAGSAKCANLIAPNDMRYLPRCDTYLHIDHTLTGALALSISLEDSYFGNVNYYGLPSCEE